MVQKLFLLCVLLIGVALSVFAGMAYFELRNAATSETPPSGDSMPLTRIVGPELFDTAKSGAKPSELAKTTFSRIYTIGLGGFFLVVFATVFLVKPKSDSANRDSS